MPQPAADPFSAISEPRRRALLELLLEQERAVNDVAAALGWEQPTVSKHLRVLREADLVRVRRAGRQRFYSANLDALDPVRSWVEELGRSWDHHLGAIRDRAEAKAARRN